MFRQEDGSELAIHSRGPDALPCAPAPGCVPAGVLSNPSLRASQELGSLVRLQKPSSPLPCCALSELASLCCSVGATSKAVRGAICLEAGSAGFCKLAVAPAALPCAAKGEPRGDAAPSSDPSPGGYNVMVVISPEGLLSPTSSAESEAGLGREG